VLSTLVSRPGSRIGAWTLALGAAAALLLAGCAKKADEGSSAPPPGSQQASSTTPSGSHADGDRLAAAAKALQDEFTTPTSAFHFACRSKSGDSLMTVEADVSQETMTVVSGQGDKKETNAVQKAMGEGWTTMAALPVNSALLGPLASMAYASPVTRSAGFETLPTGSAERFDFNTAEASGTNREALDAVSKMTGFTRVQGSAWVDKLNNHLVKYSLDSELKGKDGKLRTEHFEGQVTPAAK